MTNQRPVLRSRDTNQRMPGSYDMGPLHLVSPSHPAPAPSADTDIMEEEDRAWSPADYMR